jgi:hypothetical protein
MILKRSVVVRWEIRLISLLINNGSILKLVEYINKVT